MLGTPTRDKATDDSYTPVNPNKRSPQFDTVPQRVKRETTTVSCIYRPEQQRVRCSRNSMGPS